MNHSFYAIFQEILLEFVAMRTENGEDVIDTIARSETRTRIRFVAIGKQSHEVVAYFSFIKGSNVLATLVGCIEMLQFYGEDGGLDLVDARIAAKVIEDVFLCGTVVAEGLYGLGEFIVVGGHSTSIAQRTKVLARIERMACGIAKGSGFFKGKVNSEK